MNKFKKISMAAFGMLATVAPATAVFADETPTTDNSTTETKPAENVGRVNYVYKVKGTDTEIGKGYKEGVIGEDYVINPEVLENYKYSGAEGETTGKFSNETPTITFYYESTAETPATTEQPKETEKPAEDKKEEVLFMNRAINYFAKNDDFEETSFMNEVFENPDLIPEFKHYKVEKGPKYQIEDVSTFPIANKAVSDVRKKIKNVIDLDTNIQIRMDFINPESADKFIEKGWDEEKQMYYYLVYFNKEQKGS